MSTQRRDTADEESTSSAPDDRRAGGEARSGLWTGLAVWGSTAISLVGAATFVVEALLALRLTFRLADANASNAFVDFVYDLTDALVAPFRGITTTRQVEGGVFEPETAIAMIVYLLAAIALLMLLRAVTLGPVAGRERVARHGDRDHPVS